MRPPKAHKPAAVALLQWGPEVHAALESAARRSGHSKSEFVRLAVQGAIQAQEGYWERLLMDVFCTIPELVEAAADAGLLTKEEAKKIIRPWTTHDRDCTESWTESMDSLRFIGYQLRVSR